MLIWGDGDPVRRRSPCERMEQAVEAAPTDYGEAAVGEITAVAEQVCAYADDPGGRADDRRMHDILNGLEFWLDANTRPQQSPAAVASLLRVRSLGDQRAVVPVGHSTGPR